MASKCILLFVAVASGSTKLNCMVQEERIFLLVTSEVSRLEYLSPKDGKETFNKKMQHIF